MTATIHIGDARTVLATLKDQSIQMCVTSPPYFGLRDYGVDGQIGLEGTVEDYVQSLVDVFREVRRVLKDDGTMKAVGPRFGGHKYGDSDDPKHATKSGNVNVPALGGKRNKRSVWQVSTKPFKGAHFATFPPDLIEPCILAGSRIGDTVLDPFGGAGTTGMVAERLSRDSILVELNPAYAELGRSRIVGDAPMMNRVEVLA